MNLQQEADQAVHWLGQHVQYALIDAGCSHDEMTKLLEALVMAGADGIHRVDETKLKDLRGKDLRRRALMYFGLVAIAREFSGRIDPRLADKLRDISDETERWLRRPKKRHGLEWLVPIDWGA